MSEFLTVRLSSEQQSTIPWLIWSTQQQEVIASGEVAGWEHLDELASYADQRQIIVLLSGSDCVLTEVAIPPGASRQFESMLPFLVEDEVAQDVENLHFTVLNKQSDKAQICAVESAWVEIILQRFTSQKLSIKRVLPDVLALPTQEGSSSAVLLGDQWLLRHSATQGAVVDTAWLDLYLSAYMQHDNQDLQLECYSSLPDSSLISHWVAKPEEMAMALLAQGAIESNINLLAGAFKPKSSWGKHLKVWKKTAIAACIMLVASVTHHVMMVYKHELQAKAYRDESLRIIKQIFPDKTRFQSEHVLRRQLKKEVTNLSGGAGSAGMLPWLAALPKTLGQVQDIQITNFKYDGKKGEVRIQARSSDFQPFEQARVKLEEQFNVSQGQSNRNNDAVIGSFVLTQK
ncbi:type II secretion system protein GspL [Vibrio sagamiensis]|uniref:Type II secretion system protein L n=1 Tax=Vibrio sagamiensis NBRC 104589 TaxID=1219064 RepID=A0A511QHD3_9VIBR|nr:type II secretion system protein GspL [Vibrio sagamiensis]PNQ71282.1 type II secretion system protein GspL [Vibrio agarivorans]GEM75862.1 type II secretion system protein L [Vibrio sagamiensis NBRC 104589]